MNIFTKIKFIFRRPKVIVVAGQGRKCAKEAIFQVLNQYPQAPERSEGWRRRNLLRPGKNVLLSESDLKSHQNVEGLKFLVNKSSLFILVVSHIGDIPDDKDSFVGDRAIAEEIRKLVKIMPSQNWLVLNFDDETVREIADVTNLKILTFGFQQGADFQASDMNLNGGTNFKINYKGNIVPFWFEGEGVFGKEQIYSALAAVCIGTILDLNLIEISQALKNYRFGKRD